MVVLCVFTFYLLPYQGSRIKDLGPCFGMNGHPRRDTDVISRLSKSTIQDLSFYIGFTRIGSRIKDRIKDQRSRINDLRSRIQGPCFGMNEHPGRDTDMISRLSKSTIEDLSFYIGFTMELLASRILDLVLA